HCSTTRRTTPSTFPRCRADGCRKCGISGRETRRSISARGVILSREDGEGSPVTQLEILRFAQDDTAVGQSEKWPFSLSRVDGEGSPARGVILSREDGEGSRVT